MEKTEGRNAQKRIEEMPVSQEPEECDEEYVEQAPLPGDDEDDAEDWQSIAHLPDDEEEAPEIPVTPMEMSDNAGRKKQFVSSSYKFLFLYQCAVK